MKVTPRLTSTERFALANRAKRKVDENFTLEMTTYGLEVGIKQVLELPGFILVLRVVRMDFHGVLVPTARVHRICKDIRTTFRWNGAFHVHGETLLWSG